MNTGSSKKNKSVWVIALLIITVPFLIYGLVTRYADSYESLPVFTDGTLIHASGGNFTYESKEFQNQNGKLITFNSLRQKIIVVNFFFTHCPGICPKMMANEKKIQEIFASDHNIIFLSFTVDPANDSVPVLTRYADLLNITGDQWQLLTGEKKDIYQLARRAFNLSAGEGDGGKEDFIHSDKLVLLDQKRQIRGYYNGTDPEAINQLTTDIKKLKNED